MGLFSRKKKGNEVSPFELDWGEITPDGYNSEKRESFYVANFLMTEESSRKLAKIYLSGKINWYEKHLPKGSKHHLRLDISGQREIKFEIDMMRNWKDQTVKQTRMKNDNIDLYIDILA